jgi:hypothetical protein
MAGRLTHDVTATQATPRTGVLDDAARILERRPITGVVPDVVTGIPVVVRVGVRTVAGVEGDDAATAERVRAELVDVALEVSNSPVRQCDSGRSGVLDLHVLYLRLVAKPCINGGFVPEDASAEVQESSPRRGESATARPGGADR